MTFTKERLIALSSRENVGAICGEEIVELARIALSALTAPEQEPVYQVQYGEHWRDLDKAQFDDHVNLGAEGLRVLYTSPPAPVVPDGVERKDFEAWAKSAGFNEDWYFFTNTHPNHYDDDHINDMWASWNACRAATLQGNHRDLSYPVDPQIAAYETIMEQAIPDGYALVPVEPTEDMVIHGFESVPHPLFQPSDWDKYQTMSGCEQAAHRARLCWAAMIAAAPQQEVKS